MTKKPNQAQNPNKRKFSTSDIILMLLGVFILIRTPWSNMNSFYYLLFFLYIFCIMMRISNLRKQHAKKEEMMRKQAESQEEINTLENKGDVEATAMETTDEVINTPSEQDNVQENTASEENKL